MRTLTRDAVSRYSLEDVFEDGNTDPEKLAWANSWRKLPHIKPDVQRLYEYPRQFADDLFDRIERTLHDRIFGNEPGDAPAPGHLVVQIEGNGTADSDTASIPELPVRYVFSSDSQIVESQKAVGVDQAQLLRDRLEGHFVLSYETSGGWVAIRKDVLTDFPGAGRDVRIVDLPRAAAAVLRLMCPSLVSN